MGGAKAIDGGLEGGSGRGLGVGGGRGGGVSGGGGGGERAVELVFVSVFCEGGEREREKRERK